MHVWLILFSKLNNLAKYVLVNKILQEQILFLSFFSNYVITICEEGKILCRRNKKTFWLIFKAFIFIKIISWIDSLPEMV